MGKRQPRWQRKEMLKMARDQQDDQNNQQEEDLKQSPSKLTQEEKNKIEDDFVDNLLRKPRRGWPSVRE